MFCVLYRNEWCLKKPSKNLSLCLGDRNYSVCCNVPIANLRIFSIWKNVYWKQQQTLKPELIGYSDIVSNVKLIYVTWPHSLSLGLSSIKMAASHPRPSVFGLHIQLTSLKGKITIDAEHHIFSTDLVCWLNLKSKRQSD